MAEFKAFGFLGHKEPPKFKDFYVKGKEEAAKTFKDLWPVRERKKIHQSEKHYWRSNERIQYTIHEDRDAECAIVVSIDTDKKEELRTLFVSLPLLYSQLENKKQKKEGHELPEKVTLTDAEIEKQASDYLLSRFAISADAPIPAHAMPGAEGAERAEGPPQRQVLLNKNFGDEYETLEVSKPENCNTDEIAKWAPPAAEAPSAAAEAEQAAEQGGEEAAGEAEEAGEAGGVNTGEGSDAAAAASAEADTEAATKQTETSSPPAKTGTAAVGDTKAAYKNLASGIAAKATAKSGGKVGANKAVPSAAKKKGGASASPAVKGGRAKRVGKVAPRG
jgi:hypothetical protein